MFIIYPAVNWLTNCFVYETLSLNRLTCRLLTIRKKSLHRASNSDTGRRKLYDWKTLLWFKVHLTPKIFFAKTNPLVIWSIWAKKVLNLVESSICYALSKSRLKCYTTEFQGVWGGGCWWRLPRNQTQWRLSQLSVFARENGNKTNRSNIFWD